MFISCHDDDIVITAASVKRLEEISEKQACMSQNGLFLNDRKPKVMFIDQSNNITNIQEVAGFKVINHFIYLGH